MIDHHNQLMIALYPPPKPIPCWIPQTSKGLRLLADAKRKDLTVPEKTLWEVLHRPNGSVRFRPQIAVKRRRADFMCIWGGLAVEVDGKEHTPEEDAKWTADLNRFGFTVARVSAKFVYDYRDRIAEALHDLAAEMLSQQHALKLSTPNRPYRCW